MNQVDLLRKRASLQKKITYGNLIKRLDTQELLLVIDGLGYKLQAFKIKN